MTLAQLLAGRNIETTGLRAVRTVLHPKDATDAIRSTQDLVRLGQLANYERMQDRHMLPHGRSILSFAGEPHGRARLMGYRQVFARRPGIVPGDIVYDPDLYDLLQNFVLRAGRPVFYDSIDLEGMADLVGRLVVAWPPPCARKVLPVDHPGLMVVEPGEKRP